uniref:Uncharacterized protein n=1 Tax=Rhizophora mucronata TaxID=61149 RepID=A0A2P2J491_RHIMU
MYSSLLTLQILIETGLINHV